MRVSQAAIDAGVVAGRKTLDQASSFESGLVSDEMLTTFVTDVLTAGFGTVPNNSIVGPGAHVHPNVNPKATEENTLVDPTATHSYAPSQEPTEKIVESDEHPADEGEHEENYDDE